MDDFVYENTESFILDLVFGVAIDPRQRNTNDIIVDPSVTQVFILDNDGIFTNLI